ncbi:hypothetical protein KEJ48_05190 [Candidatus Bathyarchaeota archaeon]|nr:hypothetical protein [Candidatus Bathyarchaeota archaeon]
MGYPMGRKRQEGITTNPRYKLKAYAVAYGIGAGNSDYAKEYAEALAQARSAGVGVFRNAYAEIKPVLNREGVPSALWGLYKAFINEIIAKVQRRKIATVDEVIDKWTTLGLDAGVLRLCVETIGEIIVTEAPVPAEKPA